MKPRIAAFTLIELLVVISIITLLVSLALPSLSNARRSATAQLCATQLRELTTIAAGYSIDMRDRMCTYSWRKGTSPNMSIDADLATMVDVAQDDYDMKSPEFVTIIRRLGNDSSTAPPVGARFFPYHYYSTLPIRLYANSTYSIRGSVCPSDRVRLGWQNPEALQAARESASNEPASGNRETSYRIAYSSSYTMTSATYQPDIGRQVILPGLMNSRFSALYAPLNLDSRRSSEVSFPSQKVFIFDTIDRHSARQQMFFAEHGSSQPLAFFDGSVQNRATRDANRAVHPYFPQGGFSGNPIALSIPYRPAAIYQEPARIAPEGSALDGAIWFTAGGLKGVDFGGQRVDTSLMIGP